jgi:hypothetical protein
MKTRENNLLRILTLALMGAFVLGACRAPIAQEGQPSPDLNALYTQVAGTLIAQGAGDDEPQEAATSTPPLIVTATLPPTSILPTATPSNTSFPVTNTPSKVCNEAAFITDVTIPDGTVMAKGKDFTKTWRLINVGTCTWDDDYTVVFSSGTNLANKNSFPLPEDVSPGESVDISIPMEAPDENGSYKSNWLIRSDSGTTFGVNGRPGVPFFALIQVGQVSGSGNVRYDYAANFCDAKWSSDTKNNLPCPGANQGTNGFVLVLQNPELETGDKKNDPAIWMRPNHAGSGFISGTFPAMTIKDGDHFTAVIGCLDNNPNCRVSFVLSYLKANDEEVKLGEWDEKFDGLVRTINMNLSNLAGKDIRIVLTVETGNNSFNQANAFWFVPQLIRK